MSLLKYDPQDPSPQYIEDLATGYWLSEVLFTAVETGIFTNLEPDGKTSEELAGALDMNPEGLGRFLNTLCVMGLLMRHENRYFNTKISSEYLVAGKENFQGDSILWRKELRSHWKKLGDCLRSGGRAACGPEQEDAERSLRIRRYIDAMDSAARIKVHEVISFFEGLSIEGEMLDVGAGSGAVTAAFLGRFGSLKATLADIPEVLEYTVELMRKRGLEERASCRAANILEPWSFLDDKKFDLVVLSNIIHAYSEKELPHIISNAAERLKPGGFLVIHDFFLDHFPEKAALFDLNMLINTYNGRVFPYGTVVEELSRLELHHTGLVPLGTDTALIIVSKNPHTLAALPIDPKSRLSSKLRAHGFSDVFPLPAEAIHVPDWTEEKCRFGCEHYGSPHCPPHTSSARETRDFLKDYSHALLLVGEPPTREFQLRVLGAEKEAFKAGFYKAFSYWAGPCSICSSCVAKDGPCRNTKDARPSMEGSGIDVFETVRRAGIGLRTLESPSGFVKYFGLLLLE